MGAGWEGKGAETRGLQGMFSQRLGVCWACRYDIGVCEDKTSAHKKADSEEYGTFESASRMQPWCVVGNCGEWGVALIPSYVASRVKGVHLQINPGTQRGREGPEGLREDTFLTQVSTGVWESRA